MDAIKFDRSKVVRIIKGKRIHKSGLHSSAIYTGPEANDLINYKTVILVIKKEEQSEGE